MGALPFLVAAGLVLFIAALTGVTVFFLLSRFIEAELDTNDGEDEQELPLLIWLDKNLVQANLPLTRTQFLLGFALAPLMAGMALALLSMNVVVLFLAFAFPILGILALEVMKNLRINRVERQLPEALYVMSNALGTGKSFQESLLAVSKSQLKPLSWEFSRLSDDINAGVPFQEALDRFQQKLDDSEALKTFTAALMIQKDTGGPLKKVLETLENSVRERVRTNDEVRVITLQVRLIALVYSIIPLGVLGILTMFFYSFVQPLYEEPMGQTVLGIVLILQCCCWFVAWKLWNIRV